MTIGGTDFGVQSNAIITQKQRLGRLFYKYGNDKILNNFLALEN